jgi:hypothetical protein
MSAPLWKLKDGRVISLERIPPDVLEELLERTRARIESRRKMVIAAKRVIRKSSSSLARLSLETFMESLRKHEDRASALEYEIERRAGGQNWEGDEEYVLE